MIRLIFMALRRFIAPIIKFFSKKLSWVIAPIMGIISLLIRVLTGGKELFVLVWGYVSAYFVVSLIKRFVLFPIVAGIIIFLLGYFYNTYTLSFLNGKSVESYITDTINSHDYLVNASVFMYQIGLLQAFTIFFYFMLITFIIRLFIDFLKRD